VGLHSPAKGRAAPQWSVQAPLVEQWAATQMRVGVDKLLHHGAHPNGGAMGCFSNVARTLMVEQ